MSKRLKALAVALLLGLCLTALSAIVTTQIVTSDAACGQPAQMGPARGYPLNYLLPDPITTDDLNSDICFGANSAISTDTIAQHTPGHQQIFSLIQNDSFDVGAFIQDLVIWSLIAAYPSSLIVDRYVMRRAK